MWALRVCVSGLIPNQPRTRKWKVKCKSRENNPPLFNDKHSKLHCFFPQSHCLPPLFPQKCVEIPTAFLYFNTSKLLAKQSHTQRKAYRANRGWILICNHTSLYERKLKVKDVIICMTWQYSLFTVIRRLSVRLKDMWCPKCGVCCAWWKKNSPFVHKKVKLSVLHCVRKLLVSDPSSFKCSCMLKPVNTVFPVHNQTQHLTQQQGGYYKQMLHRTLTIKYLQCSQFKTLTLTLVLTLGQKIFCSSAKSDFIQIIYKRLMSQYQLIFF